MGKKHSFICSHVDSLTGKKNPRMKLFPDHSYTKWEIVPAIITNTAPMTTYRFNLFIDVFYAGNGEIFSKRRFRQFSHYAALQKLFQAYSSLERLLWGMQIRLSVKEISTTFFFEKKQFIFQKRALTNLFPLWYTSTR